MLTRSQDKMLEILSRLSKIPKSKDKGTHEQPDKEKDKNKTLEICLNQKVMNLLNKEKTKRSRPKNSNIRSNA